MQPLYTWRTQRCEDEYIPDSPARAMRRADGKMMLMATHRENWSLVGDNWDSLKPVCSSLLRSSETRHLGWGKFWIQALYTRDGQNVTALISNDLNVESQAAGCDPKDVPGRCWLNHVIAARSSDMGQTFQVLPESERRVVTLADSYPAQAKARVGAFTISNIVKYQDDFYFMSWVDGLAQPPGNCLFRAHDPHDVGSWLAWDGTGFTINMTRPGQTCTRLKGLMGEVRSISYSQRHKLWIAVYASRLQLPGDAAAVPGFYYGVSEDLLNWSTPKRLMPAPTKPREEQSDYVYLYPSMLDPQSTDMLFQTIEGDSAVLMFTVSHLVRGNGSLDRDIQYVRLRLVPAS